MELRNKIKLGSIITLVLLVSYKLHSCNKPVISKSVSDSLKPNEKEKVSYNQQTHVITDVKDNGTITKEYGRNPTFTVNKNGTITMSRNDWGFEHLPFVGFAMHDTPRVHLGVSLFYYNRWDANLSLALTTSSTSVISDWVRPTLSISYNVYSNTNLFVGVDSHKYPCAGVFLRF